MTGRAVSDALDTDGAVLVADPADRDDRHGLLRLPLRIEEMES